jgi:hypothetical protein
MSLPRILVMTTATAYSRLHFVRPVSGIIKYTQGVAAAVVTCITGTRKNMNMNMIT